MVWRKRTVKILVLGFVVLVLLAFFTEILLRTSMGGESHIRNFYREPENSLDVAMIGCSEMYAGYSAPLAYEEYGYTSYNLCCESAPASIYKSMMREIFSRQSPQAMVIEVNGYFYTEERMTNEGNLRRWLDNMKMGKNWYNTINELVPEDERMDYFFKLSKYHDNWKNGSYQLARLENKGNYYKGEVSLMKSFATRTTSSTVNLDMRENRGRLLTDIGEKYLKEDIKFLQDKGMKNVLFVRMPHAFTLDEESEAVMEKIITEAGYDFMNCDDKFEEIGLDSTKDFYNAEHMNVFGNRKFTHFIGGYIMDNYNPETKHTEKVDSLWKDCVEYTERSFAFLEQRTSVKEDRPYFEFTDYDAAIKDVQERRAKRIALEKAHPENANRQ